MKKSTWKIFEEICEIALRQLPEKKYGAFHCQVRPEGLGLIVDFAFGPLDNPAVLVQVTHSTSKKDSGRKFWRNIGELFEAQVLYDDCTVIGVYLGNPQVKADMATIEESALSGYVNANVLPISSQLDALLKNIETGKESLSELSKYALRTVRDFSSTLQLKIDDAKKNRRHMFGVAKIRLANLPQSRSRKLTRFTRGFSKLLLFPDPISVIENPTNIAFGNGPPDESGLIAKRPGNFQTLADAEVKWVIKHIPHAYLQKILASDKLNVLDKYFVVLSSLGIVETQLAFIHDNWKELSDPAGLYKALLECHNPGTIGGIQCQYTWLYYLIVEGLKQKLGGRQKFGLSKVIGRLSEQRTMPSHHRLLRFISGSKQEPRAPRSIERLISVQLFDWTSPGSDSLFSRYPADMADLAIALSSFLKETDRDDFSPRKSGEFRRGLFQLQYECNVAAPKGVDYLVELATIALDEAGIGLSPEIIQSAVVERARELSGLSIRADAGVFEVLRWRNVLLHTQASYANHPADKCKELTARAASMRWSWSKGKLRERHSNQHLILLLDGDWSDSHIAHLIRAGWDEVFYPHEMDEFVSAFSVAGSQ